MDDDIPPLYTDQEKINQILINLLSNAAKFTHEGSITVQARADRQNLNIAVTDTGIGISAESLERVFEEFQQEDSSTGSKDGYNPVDYFQGFSHTTYSHTAIEGIGSQPGCLGGTGS